MKVIDNPPNLCKDLTKNLRHNGTIHTLDDLRGHLRMEENDRAKEKNERAHQQAYLATQKWAPLKKMERGEPNHPNDVAFIIKESLLVTPSDGYWIDLGATRHITTSKEIVMNFKERNVSDWKLYMGNSSWVHILVKATVKLPLSSVGTLTINDVIYGPDMRHNLISLSKVDKNRVQVYVKGGNMTFLKDGVEVAKASLCSSLYKLEINEMKSSSSYIVDSSFQESFNV
ncbi:hypothetical protein AMTR_s00076p00154680 [Amborella trichopoda]|uniref:Retrovirus-related Pol polyprotein from transposon TNT 1-94-like beta-barrel domain-containing protein n=1 Tax=Amborella trichopoda TaxID=13333 RepID=W1P4A5_AMBTC|nr:hypothetical protein AMTR_s00076p00154680 [Amborella trichopoda]